MALLPGHKPFPRSWFRGQGISPFHNFMALLPGHKPFPRQRAVGPIARALGLVVARVLKGVVEGKGLLDRRSVV